MEEWSAVETLSESLKQYEDIALSLLLAHRNFMSGFCA